MTVQVHVYAHAPDGGGELERAYHEISRTLSGTPGLLGNSLFTDADAPGSYLVVSEWASVEAFRQWERGGEHRRQTAALRPFVDPTSSGRTYHLVAEYRDEAVSESAIRI